MEDFKIKDFRKKHSGYMIFHLLDNNKFEMFGGEIFAIAKFLNINLPQDTKHYIFDNYKKVILELMENKKYSIIVVKNDKVVLKITSLKKEKKQLAQKNKNKVFKKKYTPRPFKKEQYVAKNLETKTGEVVQVFRSSKGTYTVKVKADTPEKKVIIKKQKISQVNKYNLKLTRGCLVRCCHCRSHVSEFHEFSSGKCLCVKCLDKLSDKQMEAELKRPYDKKYTMWSSIVKVYQGGQP